MGECHGRQFSQINRGLSIAFELSKREADFDDFKVR
jgi:hypothetical protein